MRAEMIRHGTKIVLGLALVLWLAPAGVFAGGAPTGSRGTGGFWLGFLMVSLLVLALVAGRIAKSRRNKKD